MMLFEVNMWEPQVHLVTCIRIMGLCSILKWWVVPDCLEWIPRIWAGPHSSYGDVASARKDKSYQQLLSSVWVMMSCDNSDLFICDSNDRMIGHTLYTWLWKFRPLKAWNAVNGKSDICTTNSPSAVLANYLKLHTLLTVEVAFSPWLWLAHIHVILFCNLIGDARFQASDVNGLTPQCYQTLSYHVLVRGNEPGYEDT